MTIWERVLNALTPLGLPVAENVLIVPSGSSWPDVYITYFLVTGVPSFHADNVEKQRDRTIQVSYYNRAGLAAMPDIRGAMTGAGFAAGAEREIPLNQQTGHFGFAMDFVYKEINQ